MIILTHFLGLDLGPFRCKEIYLFKEEAIRTRQNDCTYHIK
jgi:hypothetical protein